MAFKTKTPHEGIRTDIAYDTVCKGDTCVFVVKNLQNNTFYTIGLSVVTKDGRSNLSNTLVIKPSKEIGDTIADKEGNIKPQTTQHFTDSEIVNNVQKAIMENQASYNLNFFQKE